MRFFEGSKAKLRESKPEMNNMISILKNKPIRFPRHMVKKRVEKKKRRVLKLGQSERESDKNMGQNSEVR